MHILSNVIKNGGLDVMEYHYTISFYFIAYHQSNYTFSLCLDWLYEMNCVLAKKSANAQQPFTGKEY